MNDKRVFVDTNVLVYYRDASEPDKQTRAADWLKALWDRRAGQVSIQVLNEFYVTTTCKLTPGLSREDAWDDVQSLMLWKPLSLNETMVRAARDIEESFAISWWDALIVGGALESGSDILLTEDLQDGQSIGSVTVCNPFKRSVEEML